MEHQTAKAGDVLVESLSRFAPRLDGKGFYCVQEPTPGNWVFYRVMTEPDAELGVIAWSPSTKCYQFHTTRHYGYSHLFLRDLAEILDYLSKRQRRIVAPGKRQG